MRVANLDVGGYFQIVPQIHPQGLTYFRCFQTNAVGGFLTTSGVKPGVSDISITMTCRYRVK
jgi:hypothetical protein